MNQIASVDFLCLGLQAARVAAVVRLGEAKSSHDLALCELGEETLLLLLRAVGVNWVHDQRRLHTHGGAVAAVDPIKGQGGKERKKERKKENQTTQFGQ